MALTKEQFVQCLVASAPEVAPLVDEHLSDFDGTIYLDLIVVDAGAMAFEAFASGDRDLAARIVAVMDDGLRNGDYAVENAVAVSFVEGAPGRERTRRKFFDSWPEALRDEARRQRDSQS